MSLKPQSLAGAVALAVESIEVVYDSSILAVSDVSLAVPNGGVVALLGANGAGKSTTLKAISGLLRAERAQLSRGRVTFGGTDISRIAPNRLVQQGIVHVLEGRHVFAHLSVEDNLRSGAFLRRPDRQALADALERLYAWFPRLKTKRSTPAGLTSGGEQQMIAIGRALMTRPRLVLLDEPSMGLAPLIVQEIFEIVADLNRQEGMGFLIAEQNTTVALKYAQHAYVLESGRVVQSGPAAGFDSGALREAYLGKG